MAKTKRGGRTEPRPWEPFVRAESARHSGTGVAVPIPADEELWTNNLFTVRLRRLHATDGKAPTIVWLSIHRIDRKPIRDWRQMQRIKNELVGPENEGIELYPAESRLVDTSNEYHLFCFADASIRFPFGFAERLVSGADQARAYGATQRPLDDDTTEMPVPADRMAAAMEVLQRTGRLP